MTKGKSVAPDARALYRKYRSHHLDEVLGQDHITGILRRALEQGKIAHAYLLTGPRGVGKTSVARILAHDINQLPYKDEHNHLDIIEIDAASNNGVEDIRSLREKAKIAPSSAAKKIYIIDEVHMLSKAAFNALLKTLEEPPAHVVFILATTDADKLPATILSRVQQFYFRPITTSVMAARLIDIAAQEGFSLQDDAAQLLAQHAQGGFRDAISMLDQVSALADSSKTLDAATIEASLGLTTNRQLEQLMAAYDAGDAQAIMAQIDAIEESGVAGSVLVSQLLHYLRHRLPTSPQYAELMNRLIGAASSPHLDMQLVTALMPATAPKQRPDAKVVPQRAARAPRAVLEETAVAEKPSSPRATKAPSAPPVAEPATDTADRPEVPFEWTTFVTEAKQRSAGLGSLLARCEYEFDGRVLRIYAGSSFYKKKLSEAKYRPLLTSAAEATGAQVPTIELIAEKKPLKDKRLADIAAMMGGGEEVVIDE